MFDTRLIRLPDQSHTRAHEHHQLAMSLTGHVEPEVNGCGKGVCRMRACLVPSEASHMSAEVGDNRMLIIDLSKDNPTPEGLDLLARLFEAPRYPTLDADFQDPFNYTSAGLTHYGNDPLPTRAFGGVLIRVLHLCLFGEQQPLAANEPFNLECPNAHTVWSLVRRITIIELTQVACLSPNHFYAQSKDSVDLTLYQYLFKVRLDCAARLLQESHLPLVRIAEECDLSSQNALTTAMRRYLGLAPKSLRKG